MRVTSPAISVKDVWDAATASYGVAGSFGKLVKDYVTASIADVKTLLESGVYGLAALEALVDDLEARLTAARAGYLDNINQAGLLQATAARLQALDLVTSGRASAIDLITSGRAAAIDEITAARMAVLSAMLLDWSWDCLKSNNYRAIAGTWAFITSATQYSGVLLDSSTKAQNDEVAFTLVARSLAARTLNIRGRTENENGISTVYVEGASIGTIDWYSAAQVENVVKTISVTPTRIGPQPLRLKMATKNGSAINYGLAISEMWLT